MDKIIASRLSYELGLPSEKNSMETGILLKMDIVHYVNVSQPADFNSLRSNLYYDLELIEEWSHCQKNCPLDDKYGASLKLFE